MMARKKYLNIYRWLDRKGSIAMTSLPARNQKGILKLLNPRRSEKLSKRDTTMNAPITSSTPPARENEYFTFNKDGNLIDLDDEAIEAMQRQATDTWRQEFLAKVRQDHAK
jgi:hypothetical protein